MRQDRTRRSLGTVLMSVGLLLILSTAGYFAWSEVQAGQVRSELEQGTAAAAVRATRMANELALTPSVDESNASTRPAGSGDNAATAPSALEAGLSSSPKPPVATVTATRRSTTGSTSAVPPSATAGPTSTAETTATASAPVLPVRLVIPDLKIDTSVVEMGWTVSQTKSGPVSQWVIPKNVAGHHLNSAGIGEAGNLVLSGHNNIYGRVFMPISMAWSNDKRVKVDNFTERSNVLNGREVLLYDAGGNEHSYVITDFYRLKDTGVSQNQRIANGKFIMPTDDERVTLITCWPPTNNTHRLVVIARPEK